MKKAILVARILLGLVFLASGLVAILHPAAPPPTMPADALAYVTILNQHHIMTFLPCSWLSPAFCCSSAASSPSRW